MSGYRKQALQPPRKLTDHIYNNEYGRNGQGKHQIYGYIKCKLAHTDNASVIIPDQVFFNWGGGMKWIQPFNFMPCVLAKHEELVMCDVYFDISCGYVAKAHFCNSDFVRDFDDGSQLFKCILLVPEDVGDHAIGDAKLEDGYGIRVQLFHHTKLETAQLINDSKTLLGSKLNVQGNKEIAHSDHVYFTPLHELKVNNDLEKVAMSNEAKIKLIRDGFDPPYILLPGWEETYKDDMLVMEVYREDLSNRTAALNFWVPVEFLAPQHVIKHAPTNDPVYYEISTPFIHRVRVKKGSTLTIEAEGSVFGSDVLFHKHAIIGDGRKLEGLLAPFDEENTEQKFEVQQAEAQSTILDYWFDHANEENNGAGNCRVIGNST